MTKLENTNSNSSAREMQIDINALIDVLWESKILIVTMASVFFLVTAIYALRLPNIYKSTASMSVIESTKQLGGAALMSGMGGFGLGSMSFAIKGPRYVNTVRSRGFFKHLAEVDADFLPKLMAVDHYDPESKELTFNSNVYDEVNKKWLVAQPHTDDAYAVYMSNIKVSYHNERRIIDISATHVSPVAAKEILDSVILGADQLLREFDLGRSDESLEYLNEAIAKQQQLALRNAMNDMIMSQLEAKMMTKIGPHYIIDIVDPPYVPKYRISPNRTFMCVSTGMVGLVLGILLVLMRHFRANLRKQASGS